MLYFPAAAKEKSYIDDDYDDDDSDSRSCDENEAEPKKPKRTRTAFSTHQLDQLELLFATTHYPDVFTREETAKRLNIKEDRIQVQWCTIIHTDSNPYHYAFNNIITMTMFHRYGFKIDVLDIENKREQAVCPLGARLDKRECNVCRPCLVTAICNLKQ